MVVRPNQQHPNPPVIYIMGAGRSGSTIVGTYLGNCPSVFFAGELDAWTRRNGEPNFGGEKRNDFWREVRSKIADVDLCGHDFNRSIEHSTAVFRFFRRSESRKSIRKKYRDLSGRLYSAVAETASASRVVDSSHYPLRARELQQVTDFELYIVYLARRPDAVVRAFGRDDVDQPSKSRLAANSYLFLTNLLSLGVFLRQPRQKRLFLWYDDFIAKPETATQSILRMSGLSVDVPAVDQLDTGLPFQGNRFLRQSKVTLNRHPEHLAPDLMTFSLQLPWILIFALLRLGTRGRSSQSGTRSFR